MSKEMFWLLLTLAITGLLWVPYILERIMVRGVFGRWRIRGQPTSRNRRVRNA
jgi:hypothetical protein